MKRQDRVLITSGCYNLVRHPGIVKDTYENAGGGPEYLVETTLPKTATENIGTVVRLSCYGSELTYAPTPVEVLEQAKATDISGTDAWNHYFGGWIGG